MLDNALAQRNLAVSGHDYEAVSANTKNCSGTYQTLGAHEQNF